MRDPDEETINKIWRFDLTGLVVLAVCWLILVAFAL
jgi:hypothetical protein